MTMHVQLLCSPAPRQVLETHVELHEAGTARDALAACGWLALFPDIEAGQMHLSVWGRSTELDAPLREGDRLEVCRQLRVDPKVARRERFVGQGARGTGLFTLRRPGSKAGY